ncbi:hypothetical protein ACOMHN_037694 [Nucella lapillus]
MSTPEKKKQSRAKRAIPFSPGSASKDTQKKTKLGRVEEVQDDSDNRDISDGIGMVTGEVFNTSDIHELVMNRVQETLKAFNQEGSETSVKQLMPFLTAALTTAVSVAVTEAMKEITKTMKETLSMHLQQAKATSSERRLLSAVTTLTYENDRLQQYSRRESIRIHGIKTATGETAESVEKKALEVFTAVGADVKPEDLAAVHRAGKEKKGSRPILVKFVSRRKRREVMERKKVLREKEEHRGTYLNDDLTPLRARLLGMVQRLDGIQKAWMVDGRIFCLKRMLVGLAVQQKPVLLETPDDLFSKLGVELTSEDFRNLGLAHLMTFEEDE